ncbi:LCP family protein required for cell wall assembly [Microbacterium sp. SORGH_AS 1204]|uniref:LCP family protein n=1 Tax=Microbacterium sp. SORGH_AS_1204 TaxID=3041785 RepID=UPI0027938B71|nr:LCP family protein [Microbacterium sp. SORGH_AS_1204]MDQ1137608.1 LCP family protein required for cell wall assembly [Microbacterium sp. SORGH_AS_1204]
MTLAAARPGVRVPAIEPRPLRNPDAGSTEVMTRRGWWLVVLNFLIPGSAQVLAGGRRLGRIGLGATLVMWTLLALGALAGLLWPTGLFTLLTGSFFPDFLSALRPVPLTLVQIALFAYVGLWIVLTVDTLRLVRLVRVGPLARIAMAVVAVVLLVVSGSGAAWAAGIAGSTRDALSSLFAQTGPVVPPSDGYYNILLLGGDSGEGRDSMRFDSISVISVNADTGATTITGIPRDMPHFPFAAGPMQDRYPDGHQGHADPTCGWGSGINQLRTEVEVCQNGAEIYPDAGANNSEPGIEATKDAAEGILGIQIPYYVLIDMKGFADVIDALGGVDITVQERLPKGGPAYDGQPVDDWAFGWIEPGAQHMDGDTAQWYARSRYTTSDFDRMRRQRELQEAVLAQFTPQVVLARFQQVAESTTNTIQTDLPQSLIAPTLVDLALKAKDQPVNTLELTPAGGVDEFDPDYAQVQQMVRDALHPASETQAPAS